MMKHLYFIRHGKSEMNMHDLFSGQVESPLSQEGIDQARAAGEAAKALHIDYIISSPLSRAHDTAKYIAETIDYPIENIHVSDLLLERHFGSMEGQPWTPDFDMESVADAETLDSLHDRVQAFWEHVRQIPADNILVVSHGSTGRMLRSIAMPDVPFHGASKEHHLPNAKIVQFV